MTLPPNLPKRGLSVDEAAEYLGVSKTTLAQHGPAPMRIGGRVIYDRRVLDHWLDGLAGLLPATTEQTPEEALLEAIRARQAPLRHATRR